MSEGRIAHRWHFANDELSIVAEGYSTRIVMTGEIATLIVQTIECLDAPAVNVYLAGLFSAGLASSLHALHAYEDAEALHG